MTQSHNHDTEARRSTPPADDTLAGDLPPQPRWPLVLASAAWALWIVFLVVMTWMRVSTTPV